MNYPRVPRDHQWIKEHSCVEDYWTCDYSLAGSVLSLYTSIFLNRNRRPTVAVQLFGIYATYEMYQWIVALASGFCEES